MQFTNLNRSLCRGVTIAAICATLPLFGAGGYVQHNLVSDKPGVADKTDPNLVNAWGMDRGPATPWWVNANGTGLSIIYATTGNVVRTVTVPVAAPAATPSLVTSPAAPAAPSAPTGIVYNSTQDFRLASGTPASFIFTTEDGGISAWNGAAGAQAVVEVTNTSAVYKGLAIGNVGGRNLLYAANFSGGTVDVFDATFKPATLFAGSFMDPKVPAGFAPFNVQNIGGAIYVAYAKQDAKREDEDAAAGLGFVNKYTPDGFLITRVRTGPWMNAPWGLAMAPQNFGELSGLLLVGNFGSGQIAAFDPGSGEFQGMMRGPGGDVITIDGLWAIGFGNGQAAGPAEVLFFTAGTEDEAHGLFGTLTASK